MTQTIPRTSTDRHPSKPTRVWLEGVRICYVSLHTPKMQRNEDGTTREQYQLQILLPKARKEQLGRLKQAVYAAKAGAGRPVDEVYKNPAVRDGDKEAATREADGKPRPELKGMYFLTARSSSQPMCLTRNRVAMVNPDEIRNTLYPGCIADVLCTAYYYPADGDLKKTNGGRGVSWSLEIVVKRGDATRLDGKATIADLPPPSVTDENAIYADFGLEPETAAEFEPVHAAAALADDDPF